jgi:nucleotide-binding universal stress UspA family protein
MKMLLAIDGSEYSKKAVERVAAQFKTDDVDLHVLHVDEWPKELPTSLAFAEGSAAAREIIALHERRRQEIAALMASVTRQLQSAGFRTTEVVRAGDARQEILSYAEEIDADLIVLGSHGRRGVDRFLLGSVSDGVMRHARCSVEIVRG